jgi:hypothetical protein
MSAVARMSSMCSESLLRQHQAQYDHHAADSQYLTSGDVAFFVKHKVFNGMLYMGKKIINIHS